jgi:hypothetical protein
MNFAALNLFIALIVCQTFVGQAVTAPVQIQTFHIHGTISDPLGAVITRAKVTFLGAQSSQAVFTNDLGVYEANLPVGSYSMTAQKEGFGRY